MLIDYDYAVINDQVDDCARTISHIIDAENRRINRYLLEEYWEEFHD